MASDRPITVRDLLTFRAGFGTVWVTEPEEDLVAVLCTQVLASTGSSAVEADFWSATYQALDS
jgi:CubicO group peptidase (beta-lactamase class C family)